MMETKYRKDCPREVSYIVNPLYMKMWCYCGRMLIDLKCPKHGEKIHRVNRKRIGRYSGRSHRYRGAYERY